ncbi:hypothetical protein J132_08885 [Termitomyces sp. J132]|nr:hypothetical protein J132_08885 [Termitomyces sp. J132]
MHNISQEILALLEKNDVKNSVVEWHEVEPQMLAHPSCLTALLSIYLVTEGMEDDNAQGTLMLLFHENRDENSNPSNKVFGISNCHVLKARERQGQDLEIAELKALHSEVTMSWSNIIGHVQYAAPISIDQGKMGYTSDWAIFEAAEEKLKAKFEGNIVDLADKAFATVQLSHIPDVVPEARLMLSKTRLLAQSVPYAGRIVKHLPHVMTASELYDYRPFGPMEYVEISQETQGILHFRDEAMAQNVESCLAGLEFLSYEPSKLICSNLSPEITKERLKAIFDKVIHFETVGAEVTTNHGFVTFQTPLIGVSALTAMESVEASVLGPSAEVSFQKVENTTPTMKPYEDILHALENVMLERGDLRNTQDAAAESARREIQSELDVLRTQVDDQKKALQAIRKERDDLLASLVTKSEYLRNLAERHKKQVVALERIIEGQRNKIQLDKRQIRSLQDDKNEANLKEAAHL